MGQFSFFDADKRLAAISAKGDPLEMIDSVVPFESFRAEIEAVVLTPAKEKKSTAGRKPIDVIVMFRMMLTVLRGLAEFERALIMSRTGEGRTRALARRVKFGRKPKLTKHQVAEALARREAGEVLTDIGGASTSRTRPYRGLNSG